MVRIEDVRKTCLKCAIKINNKKYIEIKGWFSPKSYLKIKRVYIS